MASLKKSGTRVGDWFLWIDAEVATVSNYRKIPMVTLRKAVTGGDVLADVVATRELAKDLRKAADNIEKIIDDAEGKPAAPEAAE